MDELIFNWDENKNIINVKKHGISFEEAKIVFEDINAILFDDPDHSNNEERFLIIGMSVSKGVCIISHCYYEKDNTIRIISARKATKTEQKVYDDQFIRR